jgi:hypothetical protein
MFELKKVLGLVGVVLSLVPIAIAEDPWIDFTDLPEYGTNERLYGEVGNVEPANFRVAVYINVEGWWTKPYFNSPLTLIDADRKWSCSIVTGGYDRHATKIAAYLLPAGIIPPQMRGGTVLPEIPEAVAFVQVERGPEPRFLSFAGRNWKVKMSDFPAGPGPNYFSDDVKDVWVDDEGLHLTVSNLDGRWYCTEVILQESFGYGTYVFQLRGRVDLLDPNMVIGLFTWDNEAPELAYRELDIEFTRWGNSDDLTNAQYVVQPWNRRMLHRFTVNQSHTEQDLTCYLIWHPTNIKFQTYHGQHLGSNPPKESLIQAWSYSGVEVPEPGKENVRFNFWLHEGQEPTNKQRGEFVITGFDHSPDYDVPQIVDFRTPPDEIITNLARYPILVHLEHADKVTVNGQSMSLSEGGFRYDVDLTNDVNTPDIRSFELVFFFRDEELERYTKRIIYDPNYSTDHKKLLYSEGLVIDLDESCVIGLSEEFVTLTHRGDNAVDRYGNVYLTSNHSLSGAKLPYGGSDAYPVFSTDDLFCYLGTDIISFPDCSWIGKLPVRVDNRNTTLLTGNRLAICLRDRLEILDLETMPPTITTSVRIDKLRPIWGSSNVDPTGTYGFVTSYGWAVGALDVMSKDTGQIIFQKDYFSDPKYRDYLSDYMGQITFSTDGRTAFIGGYGNSFYGRGGVYVYDLSRNEITNFHHQFGASSVTVDSEGFVYISSRHVDHFGDGRVVQGFENQRGIDILRFNEEGDLEHVKSFFLNSPHEYSTGHKFLIKSPIKDGIAGITDARL